MFKFMKSKKGFTLVELMIVVVIMAILVAVAVPIFSAVTKNARAKTCIANQREIVSQLSNYAMSNSKTYSGTITVAAATGNDKGQKAGTVTCTPTDADSALPTNTQFVGLFQDVPYCPAGGAYSVTIGAASIGSESAGSVEIKISCANADNNESSSHIYGATTAANG